MIWSLDAIAELTNRYTYRLFWNKEELTYVGVCEEWPDMCVTSKDGPEACLEALMDKVFGAIEYYIDQGARVPLPKPQQEH